MVYDAVVIRFLHVLLLASLCACTLTSDFHRADALVREGKFYSGVEYYVSFVEKNPDHPNAPQALLEVGKIQENILSEPDEAMQTYRSLVQLYPVTDTTIEAQERLAKLLKNQKNFYQKALTEFDKLIRAVPNHPRAAFFQLEIAECYTLLHQYQQADLEFETLLSRYPSFEKLDEVWFKKANNNYIAGRYEQALDDYERIIEDFEGSKYHTEALFGMGSTYEEMDRFDKAKAYYEKVKDDYPSPKVVEIRLSGLQKRMAKKKL